MSTVSVTGIKKYFFDLQNESLKELCLFTTYLTFDEVEKAANYKFEYLKIRYILTRALLRKTLGEQLNENPKALEFYYNQFGKPFLKGHRLHFNLTHSENLLLIVTSNDYELGVDIEKKRPLKNMLAIAKRFFHENEITQLLNCESKNQIDCFFRIWVRKEVVIKAQGKGLFQSLNTFDVTKSTVIISNKKYQLEDFNIKVITKEACASLAAFI